MKISISTITKSVRKRATSLITTFLYLTRLLTEVCDHFLFLSSNDCETSLNFAVVLSYSVFTVINVIAAEAKQMQFA